MKIERKSIAGPELFMSPNQLINQTKNIKETNPNESKSNKDDEFFFWNINENNNSFKENTINNISLFDIDYPTHQIFDKDEIIYFHPLLKSKLDSISEVEDFYPKEENFNLIKQEINLTSIYSKEILFNLLKKFIVKFTDNAISEIMELRLRKYIDPNKNIPLLNKYNLDIYEKLKKFTLNGYYSGLKIKKTNSTNYSIFSDTFIKKNTLLFELSGELITRDNLIKIKSESIKNSFFFYKFGEGISKNQDKYLMMKNFGKIGFFLSKSDELKPNVTIKSYINKRTDLILILCLSFEDILPGEILNVLDNINCLN